VLAVPAAGGSTARQVLPCAADFATNALGLYYVQCGGNIVHLVHFIEAATGRDRVIGRTQYLNTELTSTLAVSPDGKTILVPRETHAADLMMIGASRGLLLSPQARLPRRPEGGPLPLSHELLPGPELQSRALARWPVGFALAVSAVSGFVPV
jgi:hypothetical protein